jgi:hypothetical protein
VSTPAWRKFVKAADVFAECVWNRKHMIYWLKTKIYIQKSTGYVRECTHFETAHASERKLRKFQLFWKCLNDLKSTEQRFILA